MFSKKTEGIHKILQWQSFILFSKILSKKTRNYCELWYGFPSWNVVSRIKILIQESWWHHIIIKLRFTIQNHVNITLADCHM